MGKEYNDRSTEREIRKSWEMLNEKQEFNKKLFPTLEGKLLLHFHKNKSHSSGGTGLGLYQESTSITEHNPLFDVLGTKSDLKKYLALLHLSKLDNFYYENPTKEFFLSEYKNRQKTKRNSFKHPLRTNEFSFLFEWKNLSYNVREKAKSSIGLKEFTLHRDSYLANCININGENIIYLDGYKKFLRNISIKDMLKNVRFNKIKVKKYSKKIEKTERDLSKIGALRSRLFDILWPAEMYESNPNTRNKNEFGTTAFFNSSDLEKSRITDKTVGKNLGKWCDGEWYDCTKELNNILSKSKSHKEFASNIRNIFQETEQPILEHLVTKAKFGNELLQKNHDYLKTQIFPKIPKEIITLP